ncbi:unnamed protein product [Auanema sp. JU1783]|nr:unnamed protein product [Auanema sp. JU1783]
MMGGGCFVFMLLLTGISALTCPAADHPMFQCSVSTMFIIDASFHAKTVGNINTMFDYLESRILPKFGFINYQSANLAIIGSKLEGFTTTSQYNLACHEAEVLRKDAILHGLQNVTLADSIQTLFKDLGAGYDEPIVLFTANDDADDIEKAGDFLRDNYDTTQFTIVAFNSSFSTWRSFHTYGFYSVTYDNIFDQQGLENCILAYSCRVEMDYCSDRLVPSNTTHATYTVIPTYANPVAAPFQCTCDLQKVWNDVIILMEVSWAEGLTGVNTSWTFMQEVFSPFNIQKSSPSNQFFMKIGVVKYGDVAAVENSFGSISGADLQKKKVPSMSGNGASVEKAIRVAIQQFSTKAARSNSRKTIVIFGSDFTGDQAELAKAKHDFLQMGGSFIVYDVKNSLNPLLYDLTPAVVPYEDNGTMIQQALCNANCYCPSNSISYFSKDGNQAGGCYVATTVSNKILSNKVCSQKQGFLAIDENGSKTQFIQKEFQAYSAAWIGLTYDLSSKRYIWADNSTLSTAYAPWSSTYVMPPTADQNCVALTNGTWVQTDCRNSLPGICEIPPCDSTRMC